MDLKRTRDTEFPKIRNRSIFVGAVLIPFNAFWVVRLERVLFGPYPSTITIFANVVFALFVLIGINRFLRKTAPRWVFSQGEMLTIYTMLAISTGLAGLDGVGIIDEMLPHGAWYGASNHWTGFLASFPHWLTVTDPDVVRGHYIGNSTFYHARTLRAWIVPICAWTGFTTVLLFVTNCINVLVRKHWADEERLSFPVTWLPIEMTDAEGSGSFFANRLMWAGFAVAGGLSLWNGLAFLYPSVPMLPIGVTDMKPFFTAKPWNAIDWFPITYYPIAIGIGFLLPLDLLFSCWFFYLFWKAQLVVSSAMAWDTTPDFPFIREQGFGSVLGLFGFYLWSGRRAYASICRSAIEDLRGRRSSARPGEALSDKVALGGILLGLAALLSFSAYAGAALWVAVAFFAIYIPTIIVVARIRAELGPPIHDFHFMGPDTIIPRVLSVSGLRQTDLAFLTFGYGFTRAHRSDTTPVGLEGLQIAHVRSLEAKRMFGAIMVAVFVGCLSTFWALEHQAYALGAAAKFNQGTGQAQEAFSRMSSWLSGSLDTKPNHPATAAIGVGLATTVGLMLLRLRFVGFPFHPIGYAIASSWAINLVWMPLLIAWVLKSIVMRYGGLRLYRQAMPFFFGLILGDCVVGSFWALVSVVMNIRTYNFFGA